MVIKGIIPAVPTPFKESGEINLHELEKILAFLFKAGVHGAFVVGNAGEFYALNMEEKRSVLRTAVKILDGKIPIFFGAGAATTREAADLAGMAEAEGAHAISAITPFLIKPNDEELFSYYEGICGAVKIPVLPYNNPAVTGVSISPKLMQRLSGIGNIMGVKDSSGDLATTIEYLRVKKEGFTVLAGRDSLILSTLMHGGKGAISSVASSCPELAVAIYESFVSGDLAKAVDRQMKFARLRQMFSLGTFPSVLKAALEIRGFAAGSPRPPVHRLPEDKYRELSACLHEVLEF